MRDVIAQSGRATRPNATSLQNDFVVEGEQHSWIHPPSVAAASYGVAIDRFTGRVLDRQIETVNE